MKSRNIGNYVVALTVIACSAALLGALVLAITGFRLRKPGRTLEVEFMDVAGIEVGSAVRYAGQAAGQVVALRPLTTEERQQSSQSAYVLRATIEIDDAVPQLGQDVRAGIAADSFLSEKYVALIPGSPASPPLPDGAVIRATEAPLTESLQQVGRRLNELLAKLDQDYPQLIAKLSGFMDRANSLAIEGSNLVLNLTATVTNVSELAVRLQDDYRSAYSPKVQSLLNNLDAASTNLNHALASLGTNANRTLRQAGDLLEENRSDLDRIVAALRVVSQNLKVISTYAKGLTGQLGQRPSRIIWSTEKDILPSEREILASPEPLEVPLKEPKRKK